MVESEVRRVLVVGLACLDIINISDEYPKEDTDISLKEQLWTRGGNAGNSAVVLSQLGTPTAFLGTLAKDKLSEIIVEDLQKFGVSPEMCRYHDNAVTPTSCVILSAATGTRTILHANKTLPELCVEDFLKVNLTNYHWIHFEGRNVDQVLQMIDRIQIFNKEQSRVGKHITVSVEMEKPVRAASLMRLLYKGDVVFVGKDIARHHGYESAEAAVKGMHSLRSCTIICPWGEDGACAIGPGGKVVKSPAFPPAKVVDTLGAGDTFNAAVIHSLNKDCSLQEAITYGCMVAGRKCGRIGFDVSTSIDMHCTSSQERIQELGDSKQGLGRGRVTDRNPKQVVFA